MLANPEVLEDTMIPAFEANPFAQSEPAYDLLIRPLEPLGSDDVNFMPNPAYEQYLRMHKVLVGQRGAEQLQSIYEQLHDAEMPRMLSAAGWAAAEVALIRTDLPTDARLSFLVSARDCWERAVTRQRQFNASGVKCLTEDAYPNRMALDVAVLPLLAGVVTGELTPEIRQQVQQDCLNIMQLNAVHMELAVANGERGAAGDYAGFGYEGNAILAFNWRCSKGWFVIPSMARSDTGYHHREQTHDLIVMHHREGRLLNATPIEIKGSAGTQDRRRYKALLVRGIMHLSPAHDYHPQATLKALAAVFEGQPRPKELRVATEVAGRFVDMVRDYYAGQRLGEIVTRSITNFRDNSLVVAKYPGLRVPA